MSVRIRSALSVGATPAWSCTNCSEMTMDGVTITDTDHTGRFLAIDLYDILDLLREETLRLDWRCKNVEALGPKADELYRACEQRNMISGRDLLAICDGINQTIDGLFEAFEKGQESPVLIVRAVDGSAFDVESERKSLLDKVRRAFRKVADLPQ